MLKLILFNFRDTIGFTLFKKIFGGYLLLVVLFASYQIYREYDSATKAILKDMQKEERAFAPLLATAVWHFDENKIRTSVKSIVVAGDITGVVILTPLNEVIVMEGKVLNSMQQFKESVFDTLGSFTYEQKMFEHVFELTDKVNAPDESLGKVYFFIPNSKINQLLTESIGLIILNIIVSMFILWLLFIYFANKLLTKPLTEMIAATKELAKNDYRDVHIDIKTEKRHELNTLADTFVEGRKIEKKEY